MRTEEFHVSKEFLITGRFTHKNARDTEGFGLLITVSSHRGLGRIGLLWEGKFFMRK